MVQWKIALAALLAVMTGACAATSSRSHELPGLNGLEVKATAGGLDALTPAFSRQITHYRLDVQSDIASVLVIPRVDSGAAITVQDAEVSSGMPCSVALAVGDNSVKVEVSDPAGRTAAYTVRVTREDIAPTAARFRKLSWQDPATGISLGYRLFVPEPYDPVAAYPLVLFLHGAGESGNDNEAQLTANQGATVWAKPQEQARHPCFILAPQNPKDPNAVSPEDFGRQGWTTLMRLGPAHPFGVEPSLTACYGLIRKVMEEYSIDSKRIYATGLSMGGFGVYALAAEHPDTFAAVVGICGGLDPEKAGALSRTAIWVFHAAADPIVPVRFSQETVKALQAAGGHPRYTEYGPRVFLAPNAHVSWVPTYANREVRDWLFQQSK